MFQQEIFHLHSVWNEINFNAIYLVCVVSPNTTGVQGCDFFIREALEHAVGGGAEDLALTNHVVLDVNDASQQRHDCDCD
jgi:hypothetical protein